MSPKLVFAIRIVLALVWLYNGLWLKIIALDPHHLEIVTSVAKDTGIDAVIVLRSIGACESLLGIGILSGLFHRFVSYFQIIVILLMNVCGAIFGGGAIQHPFGLVISNLPTIACATVVLIYGPGAYSLKLRRVARTDD
jgi:uncharacterized membrane protein YphA (DoxX/SURF4 family)